MGTELTITETNIAGILLIKFPRHTDNRGSFSRMFCLSSLQHVLGGQQIRQINHSVNLKRGVARGLHFMDSAAAEYKLVRCLRGSVFDVVVDLRPDSTTFKQHLTVELSENNDLMVVIPPGCAHGFQALTDDSHLLYLHTADYRSEYDLGYRLDDPKLKIMWPLSITCLSDRDQNLPLIDDDCSEIVL